MRCNNHHTLLVSVDLRVVLGLARIFFRIAPLVRSVLLGQAFREDQEVAVARIRLVNGTIGPLTEDVALIEFNYLFPKKP
jgi:hypothetical protein